MAPTAETNDQNKTASEDPSRLDNGIDAEPLNILRDSECFGGKGSDLRRHKNAVANEIGPDVLEYYELRSKGLIEERPYESWGPDSPERAETIDYYFNCHVKQFFRPVDWNKGFTGRGSKHFLGVSNGVVPY